MDNELIKIESEIKGKRLTITFDLQDGDEGFAVDVAIGVVYSNIDLVESINLDNQEIYSRKNGISNNEKITNTAGYNNLKSFLTEN